eukprot:11204976-Lingulodinium_polyedra.AAC.1
MPWTPEISKGIQAGTEGKLDLVDVQDGKIDHYGTSQVDLAVVKSNGRRQRVAANAEVSSVNKDVLSVGQLVNEGNTVVFSPSGAWVAPACNVQKPRESATLVRQNNVYFLKAQIEDRGLVAPLEQIDRALE